MSRSYLKILINTPAGERVQACLEDPSLLDAALDEAATLTGGAASLTEEEQRGVERIAGQHKRDADNGMFGGGLVVHHRDRGTLLAIIDRLTSKGDRSLLPDHTEKALRVLGIVEKWVADQQVSCPESLLQVDSINESLPDFAEEVCNVVGWYRDTEKP